MRATRNRVRADEVARREAISRRTDAARVEGKGDRDRIEISVEARRRAEASAAEGPSRRDTVERLRETYSKGELSTDERRREAATRMLDGDNQH